MGRADFSFHWHYLKESERFAGEINGNLYGVHKVFPFECLSHTEVNAMLQCREQNESKTRANIITAALSIPRLLKWPLSQKKKSSMDFATKSTTMELPH